MRCVVFVLATLALVGLPDAMQPAQRQRPYSPAARPGSYEVVTRTLDRTNGFGGGGLGPGA